MNESRYQAFTRATSDVIFRMSPDWSELRYLDGRNFIADTHEPLKHWLERYIPVEDQPFLLKTIERAIQDRSVFELEHRVIQVNGAIGWTHSRAIPIIGENSAVIEWFGTASNVTPQKIAALALEDREQRLRAILQTATDGIVSIHSGGSITDVNAATEEMFGYSEPELVGRNISTLLHDPCGVDESGRQVGFMMEDLGNSVGVGRELLGRRKDGSIFPIELSLSQVDHLQLFTGIIRDVSERKQLQREIITAVEDEQRRIGQDLHDGAQQELVGLQMVAETLKLRLPQLSMHDSDAKSCLRLAEKISDGIRRAAGEIHSIARGLVAVTLDQHGLQNMLQELASRTNAIEGVICAFKCDSEISIDDGWTATHLYRIAQESVTNALKHARPEHILIRLEQCDDKLVLQVADDGEGLDPSKSNEGMGLKTMRYRAELIGARLTIHPVSAGGTLVSCSVY